MYIPNSNFLIIGLSASGLAATRELLKRGASCKIYDESDSVHIQRNKTELSELGATDAKNEIDSAVEWADIVVLSPGIPIDHRIPVMAKRLKKRIIGELELGSLFIKSPIVAVTGTNGKTTTCSIIQAILEKANKKSLLVGNIGTPISDKVNELDEKTIAVVEVSSFQLETTNCFCPHIAVILNITPDHLSRHYNLENYIYLKNRILVNMRESELAVLNYDDEVVRGFSKNAKCKILYFSTKSEVNGGYLLNDKIYFNGELIMEKSDIPLEGEHNIENVLSAICTAKSLLIDNATISEAISSFNGVKHRIELVCETDGVKFINDSKATNADATIKAAESMNQPTVIILGGKDKGLDYDGLFKKLKSVKNIVHAVLMGECRFKMLESANRIGFERLSITKDFESSIKIATMECEAGGAVLLSPATSSFDMFANFEERGNAFIQIVKQFSE